MSVVLSFLLPSIDAQFAPSVTPGGIKVVGVVTELGNVTGRFSRKDRVNRFYGIPVAASTDGPNRFRPPQRRAPFASGTYDAIASKSCLFFDGASNPEAGYQPSTTDVELQGTDGFWGTEDCLSVDVIAPVADSAFPGGPLNAPNNTYPVAVWFNGGGFVIEETAFWQGNDAYYASGDATIGTYMPKRGAVVQVVGKYRLSYLGWMSHPALRDSQLTGNNGRSGNYGLLDALNVLRWVQNNIGNFGGNPGKVTIFGQSAGATMSAMIVASPLTYSCQNTDKTVTYTGDDCYAQKGPLITGAILHSVWQVVGYGVTFAQPIRDAMGETVVVCAQCNRGTSTWGQWRSDMTGTWGFTGSLSANDAQAVASCMRTPGITNGMKIQLTLISGGPYMPTYQRQAGMDVASFDAVYGAGGWEAASLNSLAYEPVVDGYALDKTPRNLFLAGNGHQTSIMVGQTVDEEGPFYASVIDPATDPGSYKFNFGYFYAMWSNPTANEYSTPSSLVAASNLMPIGPVATQYSAITDTYQSQAAAMTDGYFAVNQNTMLDILSNQPTRKADSLFRWLFAETPTPNANTNPAFGVAHMLDLTYAWGLHEFGKSIMTDNYVPAPGYFEYSAAKMDMGMTMKKYWYSFFADNHPNKAGDGVPIWKAVSATEKHTMVFQSTVPQGAVLDPCAMFTSCLAEPTADFRREMWSFWSSNFTNAPTPATCANPTVGFTHATLATQYASSCSITVTPPVAPTTLGGSCTTSSSCASGLSCKCVASASGRRSLLFGAPSASSECYCL